MTSPRTWTHDRARDAFRHGDLVRYIAVNSRAGTGEAGFGIGVAIPEGHPGTPNRLLEMDYLRAKIDEGVDYIVTQPSSTIATHDFRDRCAGGDQGPNHRRDYADHVSPRHGGWRRWALGARPGSAASAIARTNGEPDAVRRVGIHWRRAVADLLTTACTGCTSTR